MTPGSVRAQLEAFFTGLEEESLQTGGLPFALIPSLDLDAESADLFRQEALAAGDALVAVAASGAWRRFVEAGGARRRARAARGALADTLRRIGASCAAGAPDPAGRDQALEAAHAAVEEGRGPFGWWPVEAGERLARRLVERVEPSPAAPLDAPSSASTDARVFPAGGTRDLWRTLVRDGGFLRAGDGSIRHCPGELPAVHPRGVPDDVLLVDPSRPGRSSYTSFMACAGEALAWAHMPAALPVESRRLGPDPGPLVYGRLYARRLRSRAWLEARGLSGTEAAAAAQSGREDWRRRLAGLLRAAARSGPDGSATALYEAYGWDATDAEVIAVACGAMPAAPLLEAESQAALLEELLLGRFGRRWDESLQAAALLRDMWSEGRRRSTAELLSSLGVEDADGELLEQQLA